MIKNIRKFFDDFMSSDEQSGEEQERHEVQFATAALLMEVSRSNEEGDEVERGAMLNILTSLFEFKDDEVEQLVELAEDATTEAHDLFTFTKLINEHYDYNAKRQLVRNLWEVAFADGRTDAFEEHIIRRITGLIHVSHHDFVRAKITARNAVQRTSD